MRYALLLTLLWAFLSLLLATTTLCLKIHATTLDVLSRTTRTVLRYLLLTFLTLHSWRAAPTSCVIVVLLLVIKDARKRAEAADRMKTALLQNMNADINEPLNSVSGFAQLLVEANASTTAEERAEYYKQLSSSTAKMLDIVGNVLEDIQHV